MFRKRFKKSSDNFFAAAEETTDASLPKIEAKFQRKFRRLRVQFETIKSELSDKPRNVACANLDLRKIKFAIPLRSLAQKELKQGSWLFTFLNLICNKENKLEVLNKNRCVIDGRLKLAGNLLAHLGLDIQTIEAELFEETDDEKRMQNLEKILRTSCYIKLAVEFLIRREEDRQKIEDSLLHL